MLQAWRPSVRPSVTMVDCDHVMQQKVEIGIWHKVTVLALYLHIAYEADLCGKCGVLYFDSI